MSAFGFRRPQTCNCGSGLYRYDLTDARGIFCGYVCEKCERQKAQGFRSEVMSYPNYECDEPIEPEDY